jgi:flavin-dependent dehydrogenase
MHRPLAALLEGATPAGPLAGRAPLAGGARVGVLPGLALVGDAAGFVDPVTGSGMAQALLSAELLAGHLLRRAAGAPRFDPSDDVLESFDRARRALLRDCVLLSRLVLGLVRRPAVARHAITMMRACPPLLGHLVGVAAAGRPLVPL